MIWYIAGLLFAVLLIVVLFSSRWNRRNNNSSAGTEDDDAFSALPNIPRSRRLNVPRVGQQADLDGASGVSNEPEHNPNTQLRHRPRTQRQDSLPRRILRSVVGKSTSTKGLNVTDANTSSTSSDNSHESSPRTGSPVNDRALDSMSTAPDDPTHNRHKQSDRDRAHRGRIRPRRHSYGGAYGALVQSAKNWLPGRASQRNSRRGAARPMPQPPAEFFEPSRVQIEVPTHLSPEIFYVLHYLKVLEPPSDWILNPTDIETRVYDPGECVFKPGEPDIYLYVVLEGTLSVGIMDMPVDHVPNRPLNDCPMKQIREGEALYSLLSILDIIAGNESIFRTVCGTAVTRTTIARYRLTALRDAFLVSPNSWIRPIQIIITRLMHVTMTTLYQYLGLSPELSRPSTKEDILQSLHMSTANAQDSTGSLTSAGRQRHTGSFTHRSRHLSAPQGGKDDKSASSRRRRQSGDRKAIHEEQDEQSLLVAARKKLAATLQLDDGSCDADVLLGDKVQVRSYPADHVVVEQSSVDETCLFLVMSGSVRLEQRRIVGGYGSAAQGQRQTQQTGAGSAHQHQSSSDTVKADNIKASDSDTITVSICYADEIVGGLQLLSGEPSFYTIRTRVNCKLAVIKASHFYQIMAEKPAVILPVCRSVLSRLSPFMRGVDFALDWQMVDSGTALYSQGSRADCLHVVISGRLRSVYASNAGKKEAIEEFGRGDMVGLVEVLLNEPRASTVLAVRFSQMAKIPQGLLNYIRLKFPEVGFRMIHLLGLYYNSAHRKLTGSFSNEPLTHVRNLHTLAICPASSNVPIVPFACELYHALSTHMLVLRLSSTVVAEHLDPSVLEKASDFRLMNWLNSQEDTYPLVIYECDAEWTAWTRRCLRQADALLVVANGNDSPQLGFLEHQIDVHPEGVRTNRELILLWPEDTERPKNTLNWFKTRGWFSGHHHVRAPNRMYQWPMDEDNDVTHEKDIVSYYEQNIYAQAVDIYSDFARVARLLTGNAVGLVLGGGGARGAAHVGIIKAMHEAGIPVDAVAGVSIGALIGGLYCSDPKGDLLHLRARPWFAGMTSMVKKLWDLTWWHTSLMTGRQFNQSIIDVLQDIEIDDLWIPFFCITTDITSSEMRVHKSGPLWPYVRASMTLAGYLPPMCDPADGHYLLDGGYVNNLPADVMYTLGLRRVIAIDVGSDSETDFYNYGDSLSGTWVLFNKLNPWGKERRILDLEEIQQRLAYVSCERQLQQVKKAPYVRYVRPPIECYKTMDFGKFDEIYQIGYTHGVAKFKEMQIAGDPILNVLEPRHRRRSYAALMKTGAGENASTATTAQQHSMNAQFRKDRRASLTDDIRLQLGNNEEMSGGASSNRLMRHGGIGAVSFTDLAAAVSQVPFGSRHNSRIDPDDLPEVWEEETEDDSTGSVASSSQDDTQTQTQLQTNTTVRMLSPTGGYSVSTSPLGGSSRSHSPRPPSLNNTNSAPAPPPLSSGTPTPTTQTVHSDLSELEHSMDSVSSSQFDADGHDGLHLQLSAPSSVAATVPTGGYYELAHAVGTAKDTPSVSVPVTGNAHTKDMGSDAKHKTDTASTMNTQSATTTSDLDKTESSTDDEDSTLNEARKKAD